MQAGRPRHGSLLRPATLSTACRALKAHAAPSHHQLARTIATGAPPRLSAFWTPTGGISKELSPETGQEDSHDALVRAGYIRQTHAGLYQLLPLGQRVQAKVEALLDGHMSGAPVSAAKLALSTLSSVALWERSGRWDADRTELFTLRDRRGQRYLLAPTHEEEVTALVRDAVHSYRDLPLRLYQISRKFRDELRPRHGLLRTREFLMKDLYTFDVDREAALRTYESVTRAYRAFFDEFKLPYIVAEADSGAIGGDFSHEYHFVSRKGEDEVLTCGGCKYAANTEVAGGLDAGASCPKCGLRKLKKHVTVELGHTFFLGTKYSEPLDARVVVERGRKGDGGVPMQMGCHGIGVSRLIATMADLLADEKGLRWPRVMAPFDVVVVPGRDASDSDVRAVAGDLAAASRVGGGVTIDAVIDDRAKELGWKLNDADLIGYPIIVVLGKRWKDHEEAEVQCRGLGGYRQLVKRGELRQLVEDLLQKT